MVAEMKRYHRIGRVFLLFTLLSPTWSVAALEVAGVFSDHAVLQQGVRIPIWGKAAPGAEVRAEFAGQSVKATAGKEGSWMLHLSPLKASGEGSKLTIQSEAAAWAFENVVVGEVWLASGQSNMQFSLEACARRLEEVERIMNDPKSLGVRMLRIDEDDTGKPLSDLDRNKYSWKGDAPDIRRSQSAAAYLFARRLYEELNVPVGIIETSWGGQPIEGFIPREEFEQRTILQPLLKLADANRLEDLKRLEGGVWVRNTAGLPGRIFNSRLAPLAPYPVRGAIWYQAESNAGTAEDPRNYRYKMRALIEGWRKAWQQPDMPFYFVQLPGFRDEFAGWTRVREEQRLSLEIPHTGMVVTIDLRDADIHPANKLDVGERLAKWALAKQYGRKDLDYSGPLFKAAEITGAVVRVSFDHVGPGLMIGRKEGLAPPVETPDIHQGEHFELADKSGTWHPATATIESAQVVVRSDAVPEPVAVRYACSGAPKNPNLYNRAGLPASPFCSRLEFLPWVFPEDGK